MTGAAPAVGIATAIIQQVVRFRGYYIPHDQRDDLVQEALVSLLREARARSFPSDDSFRAFVRVVAHRRCVDWRRRQRVEQRIDPDAAGLPDAHRALLLREKRELGVVVLSRLESDCRTVIALHVGSGMTYEQMSPLLGRTAGALKTRLYECLRAARRILSRLTRTDPLDRDRRGPR